MNIQLPPSEQALLIYALSKVLGAALVGGSLDIYCSPELTLTFTPDAIRAVLRKVEQASYR